MASDSDNAVRLPSLSVRNGPYHSTLLGSSSALSRMNSSAIVPHQQHMVPMQFHTIRLDTNLNHVPRDWAKTKFHSYAGFSNTHENSFSQFRSVNLADDYQDLVGRVDVISCSKSVKDLLKMPFQKTPYISLMVHRVGKTLLVEEFDAHKILFKKDEEQWRWLKDYYFRYMKKGDKNSSLIPISSPMTDLLSDLMYRNLIRHSITACIANFNNACLPVDNDNDLPCDVPPMEEESQDLKGFHHNSLWKFYDRSLLVDSNLPIFGTEFRGPCISLRLRDTPTINVLTGLDYWLDNLMSNVPEVAMVYHQNGFVQKYEVLRTEDIPDLENSKFDRGEIMDIARNVMAFMRNGTIEEGATYWLYQDETDDAVKMYNLTDYCRRQLHPYDNPFTVPVGILCYNVGRKLKITGQRRSADCRASLENCISLLDEEYHPLECADAHFMLADMWVPDKSLNDIWQGDGKIADPPADLYDETDSNEMEKEKDIESERGKDTEMEVEKNKKSEENALVSLQTLSLQEKKMKKNSPKKSPRKDAEKNQVAVQELTVRGMIKRKAWDIIKVSRIAGETDERCRNALDHIRKGLECIDKDLARKKGKSFDGIDTGKRKPANYPPQETSSQQDLESQNANIERDQLRFAKPFVPIPLHYSPLVKPECIGGEKDLSENDSHQSEESESEAEMDSQNWHSALKLKLLRKAAIAFYILANQFHDSLQKRGHTLRYVRYGLHCYECLFKQGPKRSPDGFEEEVVYHLFHLAARARSCLDGSILAASRKDFEELGEVEAAILHSAQAILQTPKDAWVYKWPDSDEKNLKAANELFRRVMRMKQYDKKPNEQKAIIKRQTGVCLLNMGNILLKRLREKIAEGLTITQVESLIERSKRSYEEAVSHFLEISEKNTAGHCAAHLTQVYELATECIKRHTTDEKNPVSKQEYQMIDKMMAACEKALSIYDCDESTDTSREEIYHMMRDKWYSVATRYFHIDSPEGYKKAKEHLQKSLNYCFLDMKSTNPQAFNSYRIGAIDHLNIAVICDRECRNSAYDSPHHRALRRKMYDNAQGAFELYGVMRWCRSQIFIKIFVITVLIDEFNKKTTDPLKSQRKDLRTIMCQFIHMKEAVDCMHTDRVDERDDSQQVPTLLDGLFKILNKMSSVFKLWLQIEKNEEVSKHVKDLYKRCCHLLQKSELEFIAFPLSNLFVEMDNWINSELVHSVTT